MENKFDLNDILIVPSDISSVNSREEVDIYHSFNGRSFLPIIVSPMDTVVDETNYLEYTQNHMLVCLPRGTNWDKIQINESIIFESFSLKEINEKIESGYFYSNYILIDIANGNIKSLMETIKRFKSRYPNRKLMVGNIANPETYVALSEAGADYVRVGIGAGSGCTTSVHTGIGYPMGSLIFETNEKRKSLIKMGKPNALIVGDGGFREYSDIIKGLALGADYIMVGSALNRCIESCGQSYFMGIKISNKISKTLFNLGFKITKKYRGMSTKEVQRKWNKTTLRSSEGVIRYRSVDYTLRGWRRNFEDYLKSTMSYCSKKTLLEFRGKIKWVSITGNSFNRFNK